MFQDIMETSLRDKKGMQVYVNGATIAGIAVRIEADYVELRSREYARIIVRLASIDAIAMS